MLRERYIGVKTGINHSFEWILYTRQGEDEGTSNVQFALGIDGSTLGLDHVICDSKAKAGTTDSRDRALSTR